MKTAILIMAVASLATGCQYIGWRKWSIEVQAPGASVKIGAEMDGSYSKSLTSEVKEK